MNEYTKKIDVKSTPYWPCFSREKGARRTYSERVLSRSGLKILEAIRRAK